MTSRSQSKTIERAPGFVYRETKSGIFRRRGQSTLHCEDVALTKLAADYGTPLYVYSATMIRERYDAFDRAFRGLPHLICYSVKANSNLSILRLLAKKGCGFDVVSGGELERVLAADSKAGKRVVFSGVGKTREELTAALKAGILLFNVESESELWALAECAGRLRKPAPMRGCLVFASMASETNVLIREIASAPFCSQMQANGSMAATLGESFTIRGLCAADLTLDVRSASADSSTPKARPPCFVLGQETLSS